MLIFTPEEIRNAEEKANTNGLSFEEMMENAGKGCAEHILKNYPALDNITVICGKGKNGGDGFVIARFLAKAGKNVKVLCVFPCKSDPLSEKNRERIKTLVPIIDAHTLTEEICQIIDSSSITVDAVFGIGFKGDLPDNIKAVFDRVKESRSVKIAIDIPSGLSAESQSTSDCFKADETLSMLCFKKEHVYAPFRSFCGRVKVIPIGFTVDGKLFSKTEKEIADLLPVRHFDGNKGTFGKALIIGGSYKMPGAAVICTKASLGSGAGLTSLAFPDKIYTTVTSHLTECVFRPLSSDENGELSKHAFEELQNGLTSFNAVAIGPGLGSGKGAKETVSQIVKNAKGKLIIDADGINAVADNINILKESSADILLTPHPGEMSRLTKKSIEQINSNRIETATDFARSYGVTLLLKGANTVIAFPDGSAYINPTGSTALSRGGAGDMLTGLAVSFAAQGMSISDCAVAAAYIHALAGEKAEEKYTAFCSTVEKINECVPEVLSNLINGK